MSRSWIIIGGGIHGVHIATRLIAEGGVAARDLCIVDPAKRLLSRWQSCTATTGMTHLRSPSVHHLDRNPWSLQRFGGKRKRAKAKPFVAPYRRPSLQLFNAHCERVVERYGLSNLHIQDRAVGCAVDCKGVSVQLEQGRLLGADNLVLAIGAGEQPMWPDWAPRNESRLQHVFAPSFDGWPSCHQRVVVVGGGISACQVALRLVREGHAVTQVSRHGLRQHQFDSDPGWLGPKLMDAFSREADFDRRRARINEARHKGSVPPDVWHPMLRAVARGQLAWHEGVVEEIVVGEHQLELRLKNQQIIDAERVLLATGFDSQRPGGAMVDELIASASLPCAGCGYPVVDKALRWHPRIHVTGPLAELELGPTSRNIAGARNAADRLIEAIRRDASNCRKAS